MNWKLGLGMVAAGIVAASIDVTLFAGFVVMAIVFLMDYFEVISLPKALSGRSNVRSDA
jgi:hypothetical protein